MLKKILWLLLAVWSGCMAGMVLSSESHIKIGQGFDIVESNQDLLIPADGAVLRINGNDPAGKDPEVLGIEDGLPGTKISGACRDERGNYWFASGNGVVSIYNPNFEMIQSFNDLTQSTGKGVIKLIASNKHIYLVTDKVLVRYIYNSTLERYQVKDSNTNAATTTPIKNFGIHQGYLYIYTDRLRYISENSANISDISLWQSNAFPGGKEINQFKVYIGQMFALTNDGIYTIDKASCSYLQILTGRNILDMQGDSQGISKGSFINGFYFLVSDGSNRQLWQFNSLVTPSPAEQLLSINDNAFNRFFIRDNLIFATAADNGYQIYNQSKKIWNKPLLNKPVFSNVRNAVIIGKQIVFTNSSAISSGNYQSKQWSNASTDLLFGYPYGADNYNLMDAGNNRIIAGTWGRGIRFFKLKSGIAGNDSVLYQDSVCFSSAVSDGHYPVSFGATKDRDGKFWFVNFFTQPTIADTVPVLVKLDDISQKGDYIKAHARKFKHKAVGFQKGTCLVTDYKNRMWMGSWQEEKALAVFTEKDTMLTITKSFFLPKVNAMTIDKKNILWLGTTEGVYYVNLEEITNADGSDFISTDIKKADFTTAGTEVLTIHVTENNEKWFGTTFGVTILKSNDKDIYHLTPNYLKPDMPLIGNYEEVAMPNKAVQQILDLPGTNQKLMVFNEGFMVYEFAKGSVRNDVSEAVTLPSPFVADGSSEVVFYVPENSTNYNTIKILDLRGRLIKTIKQSFSSGRVSWNGVNDDGEIASSGVYQFIIYNDADSRTRLRGKIAIVRK